MSEVDRRLNAAVSMKLDPEKVSPSRTWFAWYPVFGWDPDKAKHDWLWMRWVSCFCPLGLFWEYQGFYKDGHTWGSLINADWEEHKRRHPR